MGALEWTEEAGHCRLISFGQVSNFFEWLFAYVLIWPEDGVLREEEARGGLRWEWIQTKC